MLKYWVHVLSQAFQTTLAFMGSNTRKFLLSAMCTIVAAGMLYQISGVSPAAAKLEWWLLICLGYVVVFCSVYLVQFLYAPFAMDQKLQHRVQQAESEFRDLQIQTQAAIDQLIREKQAALETDPTKKIIRLELQKRRAKFEQLAVELADRDYDAVEKFFKYDWDTFQYVKEHISGFSGYGRQNPPRASVPLQRKYSPFEFQSFVDRCHHRVAIMNELLMHYT